MKHKVFVDGQEGTTGLEINDYLANRNDIEVLYIDSDKRKDRETRRVLLNEADIVFLCLPDPVAIESVSLITNRKTRIIDASTAHRTDDNWIYGIPELNRYQRDKIKNSSRVTVPGCHATGFIISMYPLVQNGIVPKDYSMVCTSITGYSGGGKPLIKCYNDHEFVNMNSPKPYAFSLNHKHLPEMQKMVGLDSPPLFTPIISNYYRGMLVTVPLHPSLLNESATVHTIHSYLNEYYAEEAFINVMPLNAYEHLENGYLDAEVCNHTNRLDIFVFGNDNQILLTTRFDNLGKGASGAAIQNMNLMLGLDETIGLRRCP